MTMCALVLAFVYNALQVNASIYFTCFVFNDNKLLFYNETLC